MRGMAIFYTNRAVGLWLQSWTLQRKIVCFGFKMSLWIWDKPKQQFRIQTKYGFSYLSCHLFVLFSDSIFYLTVFSFSIFPSECYENRNFKLKPKIWIYHCTPVVMIHSIIQDILNKNKIWRGRGSSSCSEERISSDLWRIITSWLYAFANQPSSSLHWCLSKLWLFILYIYTYICMVWKGFKSMPWHRDENIGYCYTAEERTLCAETCWRTAGLGQKWHLNLSAPDTFLLTIPLNLFTLESVLMQLFKHAAQCFYSLRCFVWEMLLFFFL